MVFSLRHMVGVIASEVDPAEMLCLPGESPGAVAAQHPSTVLSPAEGRVEQIGVSRAESFPFPFFSPVFVLLKKLRINDSSRLNSY